MTETSGTSATAGREYSAARSIVLFGNYGNGNLGDEATLQGLLALLKSRIPDVELIALAVNPSDTTGRHGIRAQPATRLASRAAGVVQSAPAATPTRRQRVKAGLRAVPLVFSFARAALRLLLALTRVVRDPLFELRQFRTLRQADCLLIGGGGQLSEPVDVFASLPAQVLKLAVLARLAGARILILNVGVIPLERRSTRLLVRYALKLADYRSVRDEPSRQLAERVGAPVPDVHPDLAYALHCPDAGDHRSAQTVAINVFPHFDGRYLRAAGDSYDAYLDTLSSFALELLARGWSIVLVPTQLRADPPAVADLRARLAEAPGWAAVEPRVRDAAVSSVGSLIETLEASDIVVATRYHAAVLGFGLGRPVLALSAHAKVAAEMEDMGQDAFVFDIDDADHAVLLAAFERLNATREGTSAELARRAASRRARLARQFDDLFGPASA
jgi:polysaccharide pyruvyl transferase WcaK-like protein